MAGNAESVLLDTSVWIDALRGKTSNIVATTQELLKSVIPGLTRNPGTI